ncbi:hypothetical protein ABFG93_04350 [Pseudalkalibacillus hwajinpoensis]|uniref:hypothetical protein n=1 Tax=Guptibacillus hwajinpoensis TaxID=208199 RepID=UPI00325B71F6
MIYRNVIFFLFLSLLIGCAQVSENESGITEVVEAGDKKSVQSIVTERAYKVLNALRHQEMKELAGFVHPKKGVLFSPYGTIEKKRAQVLMPMQIRELLKNRKQYEWGMEAGSGKPIRLTPIDYFNTYVNDVDYSETDFVTYNDYFEETNSLQNSKEAFPDSHFIEFFVPGSEENGGLDWKSLKLVFTEYEGEQYLVGVVHDQWTP